MQFRIAPEVFERSPDFCVGVVAAIGLENGPSDEALRLELRQLAESLRAEYAGQDVASLPPIAAWREAFEAAGLDPAEYLSSIESLLRRVLAGEAVPDINRTVDLGNLASLRELVPVGAHDLDRLQGAFEVRVSREGDLFTPLGHTTTEAVLPGEVVYADAAEVRTRRWVWRLGERGKVTTGSRNVFFPVDGFLGRTDERVRAAVDLLADRLRALGATVATGFVSREAPTFEIPAFERQGIDPIEQLLTRRVVEVFPSKGEMEKVLRSGKKIKIYLGVDATSPVIHVGHAVQLQKLREFQDLGHKVILLIGDFTGRIGDPTDKSAARQQLTREQVQANLVTYVEQAAKILDFTSKDNPPEVRLNGEWWDKKTAVDMIELAAYFTVQQMIQRDMYQRRLAENRPIGIHEFLYPILQGYDAVAMDVDAELGGTDQTFNMLAGREMVGEILHKEKFVLTGPLLEGLDGRKMSKSFGNVVGVSDPPYEMYGKIMSLTDSLLVRYFELVTTVPEAEVEEIARQLASGSVNPMTLKKRLAAELVTRFHGAEAAKEAAERFEREVQRREIPTDMPTVELPRGGGWPIVDLLVTAKLATGRNDAKRLVEGGSVEVDGKKVGDTRASIEVRDGLVLRGRRRQFARLVVKG